MKKIRFITSLLMTIVAWIFILGNSIFAIKSFSNSLKGSGPTYSTTYLKISLVIAMLWSLLNTFWIKYNKKYFGSLNRRSFKAPVSAEELSKYFEIDIAKIESLQDNQYTFLEDTLINYSTLDKKVEKGH
ncbi:poly-beta-1,6-N-acetyl-D-glucosamine biosynthesis protein PgaD [Clostridium cavendishii]|nr:poly-beta-1,6-N-acetyl-D-glucosamine biosynthesis protein PgaD [Clostridium cavendishii]